MGAKNAIELRHLTKLFGGLRAVDDLDLQVREGQVSGFLGPNGAWKTTTVEMVPGLTRPGSGSVLINGEGLSTRPHELKRLVGHLPERVAFYENLTALQTLEFFAEVKGACKAALGDLLDEVGLGEFERKRVKTFSKGMRQRLGVAHAIIGDPRIMVLDEPTTGPDPNWARLVKDRITAAEKRGVTVSSSSHLLAEVERLADRVAILDRGRPVDEGTVV